MSFSVQPKAGPTSETQDTGAKSPQQQSARERAIAKLKESSGSGVITVTDKDPKAPIHIEAPMNLEQKDEEKHPLVEAVEASSEESSVQEATSVDSTESVSEAPKPEASVEKDPLSQQYAAMAKREKALRAKVQQQDAAIKAREAELKAREDALAAKATGVDVSKDYVSREELKRDPWNYLQELGITYDQLTEMALTAQSVPPMVTQQLSKLEKMLEEERGERKRQAEEFKRQQEETQTAAYKNAIETLKRDTASLVKDNPSYELIAANDASGDVVELIEETFKQEGRVMTVEEAANEIEAYLDEEITRLSQLKKIQSKIKPKAEATTVAAPEGSKEVKFIAKQQPKTLTNALGASKPLSARERAILAMQGKLNK
jgi:hypothetical protein